MTEDDFDRCPQCGHEGTFGIRVHPKFSVKAGVWVESDDPILGEKMPDLVVYYAHDLPSFKALIEALRSAPNVEIVETERWVRNLAQTGFGSEGTWEEFRI